MATVNTYPQQHATSIGRPFSLTTYLLIVVALSWPFQIAYVLWADTQFARYALSSLAMVMVAVATLIASRYVFYDSLAKAGWHWGRPRHYVAVMGLTALIWVVPTILEALLGWQSQPTSLIVGDVLALFLLRFVATLLPAFSEEFGWRGYMLPHLARRYTMRRALLVHAFIWWAWHIPILIGIGLQTAEGTGNAAATIAVVLLISLIPAMMHAIVFAYIWTATQSLAVATVYHAAFDEVRDTLEASIGFGPLVDPWQMIVLTALGAVLLWKGNWQRLAANSGKA